MEINERIEMQKIVDRLGELLRTVASKGASKSYIISEIRNMIDRNEFVEAAFDKEFGVPVPMSDQLPFTTHGSQFLEGDIRRLRQAIIGDYLT